MLLTKVVLKDYGVYRGENSFDFSCTQEKPIVLVGGTNGAGKTTLFESIMLCLYGINSFSKKASRKDYEKFLKMKIHRYLGTPVSADCASVAVNFNFFHEGEVTEYSVNRIWHNEDGKIIEEFLVKKKENSDDKFNPIENLEESLWQHFIEELIPRGIAKLFFFDGEKIVKIAEEGNEDIEIKSSFDSLLGLDLIEQLRSDIQINLMRNVGGKAKGLEEEFNKLTQEKKETEKEIEHFEKKVILKKEKIENIHKEINSLDSKIANLGGGFVSKREEFKAKREVYLEKLSTAENNIRKMCYETLPFSLIPEFLENVKTQLKKDEEAIKGRFVKDILESNLQDIKSFLESEECQKEFSLDSKTKIQLSTKFSTIFNEKISSADELQEKSMYNFSISESVKILDWINSANNILPEKLEKNTLEINELTNKLNSIETSLSHAPKDDEIGPKITKLNEKHAEVGVLTAEIDHLEQQITSKQAYIKMINSKLRNTLGEKYKQKNSIVKAELSEKVQNILDDYSQKLKNRKLKLLEEYLLEGIQILLHKKDFIEKVSIDNETFEIKLFKQNDEQIPKNLLSKGEQQMFATAVLWALAKTSGKPLPFMIDTPLARLDVEHRDNLIEKFFPLASHQTIIFSTNSEVDSKNYIKLLPHIHHSYALEYLSEKGKSEQHNGYFWNEKGEKIIAI